jgi:hypothetical protein
VHMGKLVANILSPYALIYSAHSFLHFLIFTPLILCPLDQPLFMFCFFSYSLCHWMDL